MLRYEAPVRDIEFLLFELFDVEASWRATPAFADLSKDLVRAVVEEGARLAAGALAPLNQSGDREGCTWEAGRVTTPAGFAAAFRALADGGWLGLSGNPEYGGQGLPKVLGCLVEEMFWASNMSLYLYGTLTVGAAICIDAHGSAEQRALYLPQLYSGTWTGAMALTEAHAGSDLGILRTRATPCPDGSYTITGTKIFITSGEHEMAENIVHLVLARLPDAPRGTRGISLFIVPKFLPTEDAGLGERNKFVSGSIEHKMGINGSATSVINYDGATGYLLGELHQGLAAMFTMMNYERLSVGLQGLGAGELARQQAEHYANERRQGRGPSGPTDGGADADPLVAHPDVRRMLLTIRALTEAGRAFALLVGTELDRARYQDDPDAQAVSELLTPIAKAFLTDRGFECAVLAQQVFGGHGFIREWGVEQIVRDARIAQIYEGTNGIQAMDLLGRKVLRDGGRTLAQFVERMRGTAVAAEYREPLAAAFERFERVTAALLQRAPQDAGLTGAVATDYLDLAGYTIYAWLWAWMANVAPADAFGDAKRQSAAFYFSRLLPRTLALEAGVLGEQAAITGPLQQG
jgi:alkylation response protein AidB-like acyl-CoA dehydrogenase